MGPPSPIAPKVPVNKFRLKDLFSNDVKFQKPTDEIIIFFFTLLAEIRTIAAWLKSTLLLKIECQETHVSMNTEC